MNEDVTPVLVAVLMLAPVGCNENEKRDEYRDELRGAAPSHCEVVHSQSSILSVDCEHAAGVDALRGRIKTDCSRIKDAGFEMIVIDVDSGSEGTKYVEGGNDDTLRDCSVPSIYGG